MAITDETWPYLKSDLDHDTFQAFEIEKYIDGILYGLDVLASGTSDGILTVGTFVVDGHHWRVTSQLNTAFDFSALLNVSGQSTNILYAQYVYTATPVYAQAVYGYAASLPANAIQLGTIVVPNMSTSITQGMIDTTDTNRDLSNRYLVEAALPASDPRVPTQDENDALAGMGTAPDNTNRYATAADVNNVAANYIKDGFIDFVVCKEPTNPKGDSGNATNPYGIDLTALKPSTGSEMIFPYYADRLPSGRLLSTDHRVFIQGGPGALGHPSPPQRPNDARYIPPILSIDKASTLFCTFKGTGLNVLWKATWSVSIIDIIEYSLDGGTWTPISYDNTTPTLIEAGDLAGFMINVAKDQVYGEHTVRLRVGLANTRSHVFISGFEIISDYNSIQIPPGDYYINGKFLPNTSGDDLTPVAIGTDTHRRDRIVIGEDLAIQLISGTPTSSPKYYLDTNFGTERAKEELKQTHRSIDFIRDLPDLISYTLNDSVTNMHINIPLSSDLTAGVLRESSSYIRAYPFDLGQDVNIDFTFVGTGLDIHMLLGIPSGVTGTVVNFYIDGVLRGSASGATGQFLDYQICTGLKYGSHVFRLEAKHSGGDIASGSWSVALQEFFVYQAKTPDLPANHLDLGCVNLIPADSWITYAPDKGTMYTGSLWDRHFSVTFANNVDRVFGYEVHTFTGDSTGMTAEFTFTGTGVIWLCETGEDEAKAEIFLDGTLLNTSHPDWASLVVSTTLPIPFDTANGIADCYEAGSFLIAEHEGIRITGLTAGIHTIQVKGAGQNASATASNLSVHGWKVLPLPYALDNEQNWEENFGNISRNCSPVKKDSKIRELELGKQDQHTALDIAISQSIYEEGNFYTMFEVDPVYGFDIGGDIPFQFATQKVNTPIVITTVALVDMKVGAFTGIIHKFITKNTYSIHVEAGLGAIGSVEGTWAAISQ